ncbi:hypothetical protein CG716_00110 [Mycolicibacterium sphagni]|uniref:Uncharacterized protein n=1 Tax=Mycolicibacterium sphagni TaxID=1786 RepID=A0A255DT83_9MYCO|nr:hypothetical protein CG716_00110 [Mycolicibacterium sphagni]
MESSNAPAGAAADDEVAVAELDCVADAFEDGVVLDVDPEDESLLEHPAAISATAAILAIDNRFSCIGTSIAQRAALRCRYGR